MAKIVLNNDYCTIIEYKNKAIRVDKILLSASEMTIKELRKLQNSN